MVKKLLKISLISIMVGTLSLPVVAQSAKKAEKSSIDFGKISGRVRTYYRITDKKSKENADTLKESGIVTDARLGWKDSVKVDSWKIGAKIELDIQEYGSGVSKTADSSSFLITNRDKYVYMKNDTIRILMGYAWSHLNKGYITAKYFDDSDAANQNSLGWYGTCGSRVEAIRLDLLSLDNAEVGFVFGQSSDGENNWQFVDSGKKTDDIGYSVHGKYSAGAYLMKGSYYTASSRGNEDRDAASAGYEMDTTVMAFGVKANLEKLDVAPLSTFINYQSRTNENAAGKTGYGFNRMEIGVDYKLNSTSGVSFVYNTNESDCEDSSDNVTENTIGFSYLKSFSKNLKLSAGYSNETRKTDSASWNKENRLGFAMRFDFK